MGLNQFWSMQLWSVNLLHKGFFHEIVLLYPVWVVTLILAKAPYAIYEEDFIRLLSIPLVHFPLQGGPRRKYTLL